MDCHRHHSGFAVPRFWLLTALLSVASGCGGNDWTPPNLQNALTPAPGPDAGSGNVATATPASAGADTSAYAPAPQGGDFSRSVSVVLQSTTAGPPSVVAFALPLARGVATSASQLTVLAAGKPLNGVRYRPLLVDRAVEREGAPASGPHALRSVLVELPKSAGLRFPAAIEVRFGAAQPGQPGAASATSSLTFQAISHPAHVTVATANYSVESRGTSSFAAVPKNSGVKVLFDGVEPSVMATFPSGYLAQTKLFGDLLPKSVVDSRADLAGVRFLSDAFVNFADGAMGSTGYPVQPEAVGFKTEAWLYDRCATYLLAYAHAGEARHLRHGLATCANYARAIELNGDRRGIFSGKKERDLKYSHARGLYMYYALTGDEAALEAARAIADMWADDPQFVRPYVAGAARADDKLWTERLLAASIEGGTYGWLLAGNPRYLETARGLVKTALNHITTSDPAALRAITKTGFPPQSCFIHSALQQDEGNADVPWCSSWMSELLLDPLLRFEEVSGDASVDEVFVRLARSMRDAGTLYFHNNPIAGTSFLSPPNPMPPSSEDPTVLTPLYGYGVAGAGKRVPSGEWDDFEHCPDASAITALALKTLRKTGRGQAPPTPASSSLTVDLSKFASEEASIMALHRELVTCAASTLSHARRPGRDPRTASSSVLSGIYGAGDAAAQQKAAESQKVGWPVYETSPARKLSWWFNTSIAQAAWLSDAKVVMSAAPQY